MEKIQNEILDVNKKILKLIKKQSDFNKVDQYKVSIAVSGCKTRDT